MKNKFLLIVAVFFSTVGFTACERDEPEIELTAVQPVSGDWYVTYKISGPNGSLVDVNNGYSVLSTFNTAANTADQIWVYDQSHFWEFKVKANLDMGNRTFSANNQPNAVYESNVTITNGKFIEKGGRSKSGTETDSIYFNVQFDDDDDNLTYIVSGHRRTGFDEDEF